MTGAGISGTAMAIAKSPVPWTGVRAGSGAEPGARVLFTRFSRRRNFSGHPFWVACPPEACVAIADAARRYAAAAGFAAPCHLADCGPEWRGTLRERGELPERPVSFPGKRDFKMHWRGREPGEHALFGEVEHWMHVRVRAGLSLEREDFEGDQDGGPEFSRSSERGFLTSDPAHAGAGLEACFGLHLPGLAATGAVGQARQALAAMGMELRPLTLHAPGVAEAGFFLLTARAGLNLSRSALRLRCATRIDALLAAEIEATGLWRARSPRLFEDQAHRALRILQKARSLGDAEFGQLSSRARCGVYADFFPVALLDLLEELRVKTRSFHLRLLQDGDDHRDESALRADFTRHALARIRDEG